MELQQIMECLKRLDDERAPFGTYAQFGVMIPIRCRATGECELIFEKRAATLRRQPGEICFPGGRREEGDRSLWDTAARETSEELNVPLSSIHYLSELDELVTHTRMLVQPYVGVLDHADVIQPNEQEVEELLCVPLERLLTVTPLRHYVTLNVEPSEDFPLHLIPGGKDYPWRSSRVEQLFYVVDDWVIWGMTARILEDFLQKLK